MDPNIKAQWVAALRSGEYKQGKYVLHNVDENTFCCLGVLCDLAVKAGVITAGEAVYRSSIAGMALNFGRSAEGASADGVTVLPREVVEWADLDDESPRDDTGARQLAELNDDHGYSFEDLAHVVKEL